MATETSIFITLALFYLCLFTLMGVLPTDLDVTITEGDGSVFTSFLPAFMSTWLESSWLAPFFTFLDNITSNIVGLPPIVSGLIFTPLGLLGIYWVIKFIRAGDE